LSSHLLSYYLNQSEIELYPLHQKLGDKYVFKDEFISIFLMINLHAEEKFELPNYDQCLGGTGKNFLLKFDYFNGIKKKKEFNNSLELNLKEAAPNLREIGSQRLIGMGQPTEQGIENVLVELFKENNSIMWINLREEPVIYLDRLPYSFRDMDKPFENLIKIEKTEEDLNKIESCILSVSNQYLKTIHSSSESRHTSHWYFLIFNT